MFDSQIIPHKSFRRTWIISICGINWFKLILTHCCSMMSQSHLLIHHHIHIHFHLFHSLFHSVHFIIMSILINIKVINHIIHTITNWISLMNSVIIWITGCSCLIICWASMWILLLNRHCSLALNLLRIYLSRITKLYLLSNT